MDAVAIMYAINDATMVAAIVVTVAGLIAIWKWDEVHEFLDKRDTARNSKRRKHK